MSRKLKPRQYEAAKLLFDGYTQVGAAKELGLSPNTISRWKKMVSFDLEMERLRGEKVEIQAEFARDNANKLAIACVNALVRGLEYPSQKCSAEIAMKLMDKLGFDRVILASLKQQPPIKPSAEITLLSVSKDDDTVSG